MFIGSTYELEGVEAGKKAYYQSIDNMDIEEKFNFTYKLGRAIKRSHKQSKFNLDNDDALFYLNLAIELSKQLKAKKYFTKAIWNYINVLNETRGIEFATQKMEEQINEHCGGALNIDCFHPHEKSSYLGALFYREGAFNWATRLFKFQINSIKLILAEEENIDGDDKEWSRNMLPTSHYRLGMMKLKQGNFGNARQDFYDAMATTPKDIPFDKIWIEPQFIKHRIGECYFNNQEYSNAIKIYRKLFNEKLKEDQDGFDNLGWEYSNLSMLALSEFLSGQIDSAKVHFAQVEKKYDGINDDIKIADKSQYYYVHWPLYQFNSANGNTNKTLRYITDAYNHIPEEERKEYMQDDKRLDHLHKYYYIHEIIEAYNQNIR